MAKGKVGRPTKFTPETRERLIKAIRLGSTYSLACKYAGISVTTLRDWILRGESEEGTLFSEFSEDIKKAEGEASVSWLCQIEKAASSGSWQAAAWKLERRYPSQWGKGDRDLDYIAGIKVIIDALQSGDEKASSMLREAIEKLSSS